MKTQFEDYILEEAEEILQNEDNLSGLDLYERMEELMLDNGHDLDDIEDLLYSLM